jgi:hypothetical protein
VLDKTQILPTKGRLSAVVALLALDIAVALDTMQILPTKGRVSVALLDTAERERV